MDRLYVIEEAFIAMAELGGFLPAKNYDIMARAGVPTSKAVVEASGLTWQSLASEFNHYNQTRKISDRLKNMVYAAEKGASHINYVISLKPVDGYDDSLVSFDPVETLDQVLDGMSKLLRYTDAATKRLHGLQEHYQDIAHVIEFCVLSEDEQESLVKELVSNRTERRILNNASEAMKPFDSYGGITLKVLNDLKGIAGKIRKKVEEQKGYDYNPKTYSLASDILSEESRRRMVRLQKADEE